MSEGARRRGRPREYEESEVLEAVLGVFWRKGFSGATLPELADAAGITRPSLYTALGDKLGMYLRSLDHFRQALELQLTSSLDVSKPLQEGLLDFYQTGIGIYTSGDEHPRGCLAFCTATAEATEEPQVRAALDSILKIIDGAFERRFRAEVQETGSAAENEIKGLAAMASATLQSLAIRARAGQPRNELMRLASISATTIAAALRT